MSAVTKTFAPSLSSVTIIRQDALPDAGPAVQSLARQQPPKIGISRWT